MTLALVRDTRAALAVREAARLDGLLEAMQTVKRARLRAIAEPVSDTSEWLLWDEAEKAEAALVLLVMDPSVEALLIEIQGALKEVAA